MTRLKQYNVSIEWSDEVTSPSSTGTVTLPNGEKATLVRHTQQSAWKTPGGTFTTGGSHYTIGDRRFETFDEAMQKGLGLTKTND